MSDHEVGLVDTNVVILLDQLSDEHLPAKPVISAITLAELSMGPLAVDQPEERAVRQIRLQEAESAFAPIPFDTAAARTFGTVAAAVRGAGRKVRPRAFDALIAAVAISRELPLYTCNPRDFAGIGDLVIVAIPHPAA